MKGTFESWFAARTRARAIEMIMQAVKMLVPSVEELVACINNALADSREDLESAFTRLHKLEREGDSLRRLIILELARGNLPIDERGALMQLARQIDWVADWSLEAARLARITPMAKVPDGLRATILETCKVVKDCAMGVQRCIELLTDKRVQEALDAADGVERLEEEVDDLYRESRALLGEISGPELTAGQVVLLAEFLDTIENIADRCEGVCDQARVIAVSVST